jgi:hypothetical protein
MSIRFRAVTQSQQPGMPNKSPEPAAVGAVSSAVAVHVASRWWLSTLSRAGVAVLSKPDEDRG